ncbi:MAG TPA: O-antigen ligase family protein [Terriglobales bacterium]|jgi:O-antigen ligase|nr:O-antigen ligase family protein [Terriglobales bacterium]
MTIAGPEVLKAIDTSPAAKWNPPRKRLTAAYSTIVLFWAFYYFRPEDALTALTILPLAKIIGGIALFALIMGILAEGGRVKLSKEAKLVLLLFIQTVLCIPFASWRGGAFQTVFEGFDKCVIMTLMIGIAVTSVDRLRRLLFIQASAVATMAVLGCIFFRGLTRIKVGEGLYGNANDFAIMIALNLPLCLAFLLRTKNPLKKTIWAVGLLFMLWAITLTYSRSGFMAVTVAICFSFWEFGIRAKRKHIIVIGLFLAVFLLPILIPSGYGTRLAGIFSPSIDPMDLGSAAARRQTLKLSLELTLTHPIFGIGPGDFASDTKMWYVTHNTYTQLSSEAGIPAIVLFLLILRQVFRNLRDIRKTERFRSDPEVQLFTGALRASFAAYVFGAFFASYAYELFIYALIAFTAVLYRACQDQPAETVSTALSKFSPAFAPARGRWIKSRWE